MNDAHKSPLYQVIWETRRLFQCLAMISNEILKDIGLTASMRAVLEFLNQQEPQTVPQMARAKDVSRQHIQTIVNELVTLGLVKTIENPAHKRSQLIQRTDKGKSCFDEIKKLEARLFSRAENKFKQKDLANTAKTLRSMREYFHTSDWRKYE